METPVVDANVPAGIYIFRYEREGIAFRVDRLVEEKKSLWGEVTIRGAFPPEPGWKHIFHEGFNLLSGRTRKSMANTLEKQVPHLDWSTLLEQVCMGVIQRHREGEAVIQIKDFRVPESIRWRVEPLVLEGAPTLLYGYGGTGKSYFAAYLAMMTAEGYPDLNFMPEPGPVLYLDYENTELDSARRFDALHKGLDLPCRSSVHYRRCAQRLASEIQEIQKAVLERGIQMVIVDTAGPACGGDPESAQSAIQFFMALRSLNITSIILAHKSKAAGAKGPFGSVYWTNYPRNVFNIKGAQEEGATSCFVGLFHEKTNDGRLMKPMGFRLEFIDEGEVVRVHKENVGDIPELEENLGLVDRITNALRRNRYKPMTVTDLADELEAKAGSIRQALSRQANTRFVKLSDNRWGLLHSEVQEEDSLSQSSF